MFNDESDIRKSKSEPRKMSQPFERTNVLDEEVEVHLVRALENRRARAAAADKGWDASVEGERPPLRRVTKEGAAMFYPPDKNEQSRLAAQKRFRNLAKHVFAMKSQGRLNVDQSETLGQVQKEPGGGKGVEVHDVFLGVGGEETKISQSQFSRANTNTDRLFSAALAVDENFKRDDEVESIATNPDSEYSENMDDERLPLTGAEETQRRRGRGWFAYGSADDAESRRQKKAARRKRRKRNKKCLKVLEKACCLGQYSWLAEVFHPTVLAKAIFEFILRSWFSRIGIPALITAFILFYYMGNPTLDFFNQATASWWLIFVARQCLMLELAIAIDYVVIDGWALRSRLVVNLFGPWLTLFIIDAKGWPFIVATWATCAVFLLEGDNNYQQNWLYFADIPIFSPANNGGHVLYSAQYIRVLVAMVVAGLASAIKRITIAMYFGKKTVRVYKPRLDKISADIFVIAQVAKLASEADHLVSIAKSSHESINKIVKMRDLAGKMNDANARWGSITQLRVLEESDQSSQEGQADANLDEVDASSDISLSAPNAEKESMKDVDHDSLTSSDGDDGNDDSDIDSDEDDDDETGSREAKTDGNAPSRYTVASSLSKSTKSLKSLLDRWEEPVSSNKTMDASISDILTFRKRLSYMDQNYPFSLQFGPARTRDECIKSSQNTYRHLMKLEPKSSVLSFDVIGLLAFQANGVEDEAKKLVLQRLFHPDRFNEISLLAFVQACDSVYRRLRYFRASVGNSSVIDRVLEQVIDGFFYFVLILLTLSILDINPWKLLISLSSIIVSFAFAVGPSASKYIEGVLLIVARRPYDIGDRILVVGPENAMNYGVGYSWFVEDINLFSTTLRFAATNEVATVNNSSIALSRIINCNRSSSALVTLDLQFLDTTTDEQLAIFREAVGNFVQDRPRVWDSVLFFRRDAINQNLNLMECTLRCRHTKSWQDAASILMSRSELLTFSFEMGKTLGINYDSPPRRQYVVNAFAPSPDASAALLDTTAGVMGVQSSSDPFAGGKPSLQGSSDAAKALFLQAKGLKR